MGRSGGMRRGKGRRGALRTDVFGGDGLVWCSRLQESWSCCLWTCFALYDSSLSWCIR